MAAAATAAADRILKPYCDSALPPPLSRVSRSRGLDAARISRSLALAPPFSRCFLRGFARGRGEIHFRLLVSLTFVSPEATDLLQKLSLDTTGDAGDVLATKEKKAPTKGVVAAVGSLQPGVETLQMQDYNDTNMYYGAYPAYAYGVNAYGGWGDYSTYLSHDGAQTPTPGAYADMYYGYAPYGVATLGHDGQIYGSQNYQYPLTYNKQQNSTAKVSSNVKSEKLAPSPQGDVSTNGIDGVKSLKNSNSSLKSDRPVSNGSYGRSSGRSGSYQNQTNWSAYPYYSSEMFSDKQQKLTSNRTSTASNAKTKGQSRNQNTRQYPHLMTPTSPMGSPSIYSANGIYGYDGSSYGPGLWYGSHMYSSGVYGGWNALYDGKYRPRGRDNGYYYYGNGTLDGFNELKRGPRSGMYKNQQGLGATTEVPAKEQDLSAINGSHAAMKDQYNLADFVETYSEAKFFIIKSYSEDDVHKSIKYNVWASTPNGNKKLDAAYQEAKEKSSESPVFLLFSVNASGQFVGLAEMVGRVDFNKTVEHWQQDKWTGCFPVKWHIVKDVPNSLLKHIILENNENKPVTNSRDTHEVKLEQGLQVLKIFKDHVCKTSILDDFGFYDNREKMMQERKAKQQQSLKKVTDVKLPNAADAEKESPKEETESTELTKVEVDVLNIEPLLDKSGEKNDAKGNGAAPEDLKSPTEK
ncbi:YTH domain-containing family protein 2 [Dichanthelium oligosanthes]|uniref:YTH domain-containing family protein n=1 Tax=Dichanthelium oligosanthes TaxID=888268 RepID=A0A1E5UKN0_9POAL|nr:YTH domain-containing family protein 2 [Dichanthelium oligosanthes]